MEKKKGMSSKYIQFFLLAILFGGFMFFSAPGGLEELRVYQFGGSDSFVSLQGGQILLSSRGDRISLGVLTFREGVALMNVQIILFADDEYGNTHEIFSLGTGGRADYLRDTEIHNVNLGSLPYDIEELRINIENIMNSFHCKVILYFPDGTTREAAFELFLSDVFGY